MVRTRHSLPDPDSAIPSDPLEGIDTSRMTERQKRDLRNLKIDANARLLSSSNPKSEGLATSHAGGDDGERRVYHYRGAVYEIQGTEPEDWLEEEEKWREAQEAKARAKKRKREEEEELARKRQQQQEEEQRKVEAQLEALETGPSPKRRRKSTAAADGHEQPRRFPGLRANFEKPVDYDSWPRKVTAEEDAHLRPTMRGYTSKQYSYRYHGSTDDDPIYGEAYARAKGYGWVKEAYGPEVVERGEDKACLGLVGDLIKVQEEIGRMKGRLAELPRVARKEGRGIRRDSAAAVDAAVSQAEVGGVERQEKVVEKEKEVSRVDSAVEDEISPAPAEVGKEDAGEGRAETELAAMRSAREGQSGGSKKDAVLAQLTANRMERLDGLRREREEEQLLRMFDV